MSFLQLFSTHSWVGSREEDRRRSCECRARDRRRYVGHELDRGRGRGESRQQRGEMQVKRESIDVRERRERGWDERQTGTVQVIEG